MNLHKLIRHLALEMGVLLTLLACSQVPQSSPARVETPAPQAGPATTHMSTDTVRPPYRAIEVPPPPKFGE